MKKRIVSLLLALVMMTSLLPTQVFAEDVDTLPEQPAAEQTLEDARTQEAVGGGETVALAEDTAAEDDPTVVNLSAYFAGATTINSYKLTNFTFEQGKTTYDLAASDVPAAYAFRFELSKIPPALTYLQTYKNGQFLQRLPVKTQVASAPFQRKNLPALGASETYTVIIGTKASQAAEDFITKYAEYTFNITTSIPSLSAFAVKDTSGTALDFTNVAKFDNKRIDIKDYAVTIPGDDTAIKLTATSPTAGMQFKIGEKTYDSLNDATIELTPFATENTGEYKLPIVLTKDGYENTYTLTVTRQDYTPKIIQQPASVTCNKGDTPTLSIVAEKAAGVTEELTYQWFSRTGSFKEIPGATSSTYTPPTNRAGAIIYRCDVSSTVNGTKHTTQSDFATVTVNLSSVDAPEIIRQPGTFKVEKYGISESYKTEYFVGEKLDQIYIGLDMLETGEVYSYKWYYSTENVTTGGTPLEESHSGIDHDGTWCEGFVINNRFEEGTYYLYCEVTASSESNPTLTATTTTDTAAVTFTRAKIDGFSGKGSETEPYLINTADDFARLRSVVEQRQYCTGLYFKMTDDITLPEDWEPIGREYDADENPRALPYMGYRVFRGILDGDGHKLTIPEGGKPLFNYTSDAVIRNLDIYGVKINGYGLINKQFIDYGTDNVWNYGDPVCVTIENVKLLSGSKTLRSGFLEGSGSGINTVTIRNCTIEENVVIGYDKTTQNIGSFVGGNFNGVIENCKSYATVYGRSCVGGLAAGKGQTMGLCKVKNSQFYGQVIATGDYVGGILGMGYADVGETRSAPNSPWVTIENCTVIGSVTGRNYVGGVFGAEIATTQCWGNDFGSDEYTASSSGSITNNTFEGTITATGDYVGGVIGYIEALNRYSVVANNYYSADCGVDKGIGFVKYVDTNCETHETASGAIYFDTSKALPGIDGVVMKNHNRTDDPLGADKEKLCSTTKRTDKYMTDFTLSGEYKTEYKLGETLDTTGMTFTAIWSDNTTSNVDVADVTFSGFQPNRQGVQTVTAQYNEKEVRFQVTVKKVYTDADKANFGKATVYFSLSEDGKFKDSGSTTLAGLETTVTYFNLADYGLEKYYCYDDQGNVIEKPTLLHLYIRMLEQYYLNGQKLEVGGDALTVSGGAGSLYMQQFWGHNYNLLYYVNHEYPMGKDGRGSTADQILLTDGDVIEVAMYENMKFYTDPAAGFPYFADAQGKAVDRSLLKAGQELTLVLYRAPASMGSGSTVPIIMANTKVYVADERTGDQTKWREFGTTNDKGEITVKFDAAGDQFLYVAGAVNDKQVAVGSPTICALRVAKDIHDVTLPSGVKGDTTVAGGDNYTFRLDRESGYTYTVKATMGGKDVEVIDNGDGTYTVKNITGKLEITVTKTANNNNTGNTGNTGNNSSAKNPYQKDNKADAKTDGKDVKSGNTGDAGITLYLGMGLVAALAGAVIVTRKRKEN